MTQYKELARNLKDNIEQVLILTNREAEDLVKNFFEVSTFDIIDVFYSDHNIGDQMADLIDIKFAENPKEIDNELKEAESKREQLEHFLMIYDVHDLFRYILWKLNISVSKVVLQFYW